MYFTANCGKYVSRSCMFIILEVGQIDLFSCIQVYTDDMPIKCINKNGNWKYLGFCSLSIVRDHIYPCTTILIVLLSFSLNHKLVKIHLLLHQLWRSNWISQPTFIPSVSVVLVSLFCLKPNEICHFQLFL